jgi:hypothetical protein
VVDFHERSEAVPAWILEQLSDGQVSMNIPCGCRDRSTGETISVSPVEIKPEAQTTLNW